MRLGAIVIVGLLVLWVAFGAPVPMLSSGSLEPSDQVATFEQSLNDLDEFRRAVRDGRLKPDPERDKLRQRVLRAAERLDRSPCNASLQEDFTLAAVPFLETVFATVDDPPVETLQVGDRVLNGTKYLDRAPFDRVQRAANAGHLRKERLPRSLQWMVEGELHGKFAAASQALNDGGC